MPNIDLSILNQRQTPAFYADVFANRPAAGFVGRIFVSTDTYAFYRDNGTGWDLIGGPGTGTVTGSGAAGQVAFWSGSSLISGENNLWWDSTNNHFGINTNTPGTAADIHHDQSTILQLNQTTATNDTRIAFQNAGSSKWRVGNFYSAGSNDYKVNDAVLNINRFTIKSSSGQTFVGDETTSSGLFVVNNSSGDAHIVALGATAPSIRVRNAGVGASLQFGLGLATTTNNFIQGSTGGEFCIFNDSLTAQPILFGIKDAGLGNTQEAARISASRNFLVGTTTDAGQKLQVNGTAFFNNSVTSSVASGNGSFYINNGSLTNKNWTLIPNTNSGETDLLFFYTGTGASTKLTIASTGAATFSSSVTASAFVATNGNNNTIVNSSSATTGWSQYAINNTSGSMVIGVESSVAGTTTTGSTAYATILRNYTNTDLQLATNNIVRQTITSAGLVGIGTTSPTEKLVVSASSSVTVKLIGSVGGGATNNTQLRFYGQNAGADLWAIGSEVATGSTGKAFDIYNTDTSTPSFRITGGTNNVLINTTTDNGYKLRVNGNVNVDGYISTSPSVNGIFCNINQHNTTVTLSSIFPNLNFTNTFISLNLQIIASSGSVTNATSFIYNCVRDYNGNWSSTLVNSVGTVAVLTLTFGGTNAAPTLTITGVSFMTVTYNISILI